MINLLTVRSERKAGPHGKLVNLWSQWELNPIGLHNRLITVAHICVIYTSYAMLLSRIPWNMPCVTCILRRVCIRRKYKWQVACSMVSHEKALHNYFIPCLNLRNTYGNFGKSLEISANFRKFRKCFKPFLRSLNDYWNFWKTLETVQKCFPDIFDFLKSLENLQKTSEVFGNFRKTSETVEK